MGWGTVELEPEVRAWLEALPATMFARVAFHIDLLADAGPLLGEPHTRQLDGKIVLLTVFAKTRMRERAEIERARRAMERCIAERHTAEEVEIHG
ncbi:type II toxin-antitoxin system RelE/ParE family toxin [Nocardia amikacinitolerans]|uniref:type II toxin-antitoxin system RelE/ParE family toxin n=1 Tax=Nocardia amikacinitolerans TaxID=756689 RepID=UPI003695F265